MVILFAEDDVYSECMLSIFTAMGRYEVQRMAEDIVSVQPMPNINLSDPLLNLMLSLALGRLREE